MPEYKHSRQLTIVSDVHTWAYIPPNPSFKDTCTPTLTAALLTIAKAQNDKVSSDRLMLKDNVVNKCIGLLAMKRQH